MGREDITAGCHTASHGTVVVWAAAKYSHPWARASTFYNGMTRHGMIRRGDALSSRREATPLLSSWAWSASLGRRKGCLDGGIDGVINNRTVSQSAEGRWLDSWAVAPDMTE